ncbi:MAG: hypothetical protein KJ811_01190 [Candidatus Margulisbacteria bacterium]|nr:hypothetical protein [Candidatus Margulisiibacteriota bacterium]
MGIEVNQQQLGVAASLAATEGLDSVVRSELERQTDTANGTKVSESVLKKALQGKRGNIGTQIIAGLAAKLVQKMPTLKLGKSLEKDFEFLMNPQEEGSEDSISINNPIARLAKSQKQKQQNQQSGSQFTEGEEAEADQQSPKTTVKEYLSAYSQMLTNGGSEVKKTLEKLETQLLKEEGVSLKDLQGVKVKMANSVRSDVLKQIKGAYIKQVLAGGKSIEGIMAKREVSSFIDYAFMNDALGGFDFGGLDGDLQGAVNKVKAETGEELKEFVEDAISKEVMKKAMGDESAEVEKEIENLLKLGLKVGFDVGKFAAKIPQMKEELGLDPLITFDFSGGEGFADGDQREKHRYQYTRQDENDILIDKLRAIYLRRAVFGDVRSVLETQFKMMKLKNGLIKLGVKNFDEIEVEGQALAKVKLMEMLREGFEERATYAKLAGPAYKMTEKKIKTVLKNLEKVGVTLAKADVDQIRDKANKLMLREADLELSLVKTAIASRGEMKYLTTKRKTLEGILSRVSAESHLQVSGHELELKVKEAC